MKMFNESDVLNERFRVEVIKEIRAQENQKRKREAQKRQEVYRDNVLKWVLVALEALKLRPETLQLMKNHAANISIAKKIVNKKARCYRGGVQRATGDEVSTAQVSALATLLQTNTQMQKADRYCVLLKNAMPWVYPEQMPDGKWRLKTINLASYQYDVIENGKDPEKPSCVVLSDYKDEYNGSFLEGIAGGWRSVDQASTRATDTVIADGPQSTLYKAKEQFIWWTDSYHFTTNERGQIIKELSPEELLNPIGMIPGSPVAEDQDGNYWAQGGDDLIDGSILLNVMITDMLSIMYLQGWGQLVISGSNIPDEYQVGPNVALLLKTREGQDAPNVQLITHNPPIDSWLKTIEQYAALLLSTNDLAPSTVSSRLDAQTMASGIAMLIERSEAQGSVEDRRQIFSQAERRYWEVVKRWQNLYAEINMLDDEFALIGALPEDMKVSVRFQDPREVTTEKEKLEIMKMRKDLGLATSLDLIIMDNPAMTREEALAKLAEVKEQLEEMSQDAAEVVDELVLRGTNDSEDPESDQSSSDAQASTTIQETALNGAQVSAMVDIAIKVGDGSITKEAAKLLLQAAFPGVDDVLIEKLTNSLKANSIKAEVKA